jgi:hypothetical protein
MSRRFDTLLSFKLYSPFTKSPTVPNIITRHTSYHTWSQGWLTLEIPLVSTEITRSWFTFFCTLFVEQSSKRSKMRIAKLL